MTSAERRAEQLGRRAPLLDAPSHEVAAGLLLAGRRLVDDLHLIETDAELLREGLGRLGGLAVLEGGALGRADDLFVQIELLDGDLLHDDRKPARGPERLHLAVKKPELSQTCGDEGGEGGEPGIDKRGGELLDADFQKQGMRGHLGISQIPVGE